MLAYVPECTCDCLRASAGFTRREIMERCVDRFTEIMQEDRRDGPERNRNRHLCLGTVLKPLGYLSSGAKVSDCQGQRHRHSKQRFTLCFCDKVAACVPPSIAT